MKTSIIIPAYNEEKRIGKKLELYSEYFENLRKEKNIDYEILVVINNTKDGTLEAVKSFKRKNNRILYLDLEKGGKGYAIIEGFKDALKRKNDLIGFVDADLSTKPDAFYDLIRNIKNSSGVIASRYIKGASVKPKNTIPRILASRIYNILIRSILLIPYRDTQCGAKLFSRKAIESTIEDIGMTQWAFDIELLYKIRKKGYRIKEIPTVWSNEGYATINFWQAGPFMALSVIRLRLLNSYFKFMVRIYDKIVGKIHRRFMYPK